MQAPTYRLEKVLPNEGAFEDFEGPLYLILALLTKNKLEIADLKIADITEQYLAWLGEMEKMDMEIASEFVSMASYLVWLKTKMLLTPDDAEALSEIDMLIKSLQERRGQGKYYAIKAVCAELAPMWERGADYIVKPPEPLKKNRLYEYRHEPLELPAALAQVFDRGDASSAPPARRIREVIPELPYPVPGKAAQLVASLMEKGWMKLRALFKGSRSRSELVAAFLAILELCRKKRIIIEDDTVTYIGEGENDADR